MKNLTTLQTKIKITNFKGTKKKKKGFTLIELVAVMAIIAILAATFVPKFTNYFTEAKKVAVLNEAKSVVTAFESISYKLATDEDDTTVSILSGTGMPLKDISLEKIPTTFTVTECKNILDTSNYTFDINDTGFATSPVEIK